LKDTNGAGNLQPIKNLNFRMRSDFFRWRSSKNSSVAAGFQKGWLLSLFIAKDRENLRQRPKFSLSLGMKRDKKRIKAIPFESLLSWYIRSL
jgi:hypothetical protein